MSRAGSQAGTAGRELLDARRSARSAVVAVVLRNARWPYSCALARSMQALAHRFARAGGQLVLVLDETASRLPLVADVWGLSAALLPLVPGLADELGFRDPVTGRADDGVGVLTPDGVWAAVWDFGDPYGSAHPEQIERALQDLVLPPAPAPARRTPGFGAGQVVTSGARGHRGVCTPTDAARALGRALASAERAGALLDTAGARARTELAARRLRTYAAALDTAALDTIRKVRPPECTTPTPTPT